MPLSELGNIGIGADAGLAARAAGAQMELTQAIRDQRVAAGVPVRGVRPAGPLTVATGLKVATSGKPLNVLLNAPRKETQAEARARMEREMAAKKAMTPQTAAQAKAANVAARTEKDRQLFADKLRAVSESTLYDMMQAVAQQVKVGTTEYEMVRGYSAEIAKEAERRYGKNKAKEMLDKAYAKAKANAPVVVADPLTGKTVTAAPSAKIVTAATAPVIVRKSFMSRFGLPIAAAVVGVGGFMWWRRRNR